MITGLVFLLLLNPMLHRLAAMLPDETLRLETRLFTTLNCYLLALMVVVASLYLLAQRYFPTSFEQALVFFYQINPFPVAISFDRGGLWIVMIFLLLPVAMTMAITWKIKEVILAGVFGPQN